MVGEDDHPGDRAASCGDGRGQRVTDQLGAGVTGKRPPDQSAGVQVNHSRQVHEAVGHAQVGDVAHPALIGAPRR